MVSGLIKILKFNRHRNELCREFLSLRCETFVIFLGAYISEFLFMYEHMSIFNY